MRQVHHPSVCVSRVSPIFIQLDSEAAPFHSLCAPQDKASSFRDLRRSRSSAASQGPFSDRSGIVGTPVIHICVHARFQGHMRRYVFEQVVVHRRSGDVPASGDQPDGEGDVSVPRVGVERRSCHPPRLRRHDSKGLRWSRSVPYLHFAIGQKVDAATYHQSLCSDLEYVPLSFIRAAVSLPTQACGPCPQPNIGVYDSPHHPRYAFAIVLAVDVASVVRIPAYASRHRGLYREDRVSVVVTRPRQGGGYPHRSLKKQDVCFRLPLCLVMDSYCSSHYSPRTVVLKTTSIIVHSPHARLFQVAFQIFKDLSIPCSPSRLGVGDLEYRWRRTFTLLHLALGIAAYSCCVNSCIQTFFVGICTL